ncbi:MAG: ferredoxin [Clostridiales bacterium 43-6]|nr:MAG: ferredoxin [Clostridiales bacterium 43-6]
MAAVIIGSVGLFVGLFLGVSEKIFYVDVDETEVKIRECLPGNNCGGCGFASCDDLAKKIAGGEAKSTACPVGGEECAKNIAAVLGVAPEEMERKVAVVKCMGSCDVSEFIYNYYGENDCHRVAMAPGRGAKACAYGCLGLGSCVRACRFDAIHLKDGKAFVSREACKACGMCVEACPNNLIEMVPYDGQYVVQCFSQEKGKTVKEMCKVGCIGCGLCEKVCPSNAVTMTNNIASIDQSKCTACGLCAQKCPSHIILKQYD